jgi:8-oxo-dGTP pyrophosphatase MutT (NUDIX family)
MPISDYLRNLRRKIGNQCIMMPAVSAIIINDRREVLLHRSSHDGKWYVIGGAPDPGEEPAHAAVREAFEETGLIVRPTRLVGTYADPIVTYSNGDQVLYTATVLRCDPIGGALRVADDESLEVKYFDPDRLPELLPTHRLRIEHALSGDERAYFAWNEAWLKKL